MSRTRKKRSPASATIEAALKIAHEHASIIATVTNNPQLPPTTDSHVHTEVKQ